MLGSFLISAADSHLIPGGQRIVPVSVLYPLRGLALEADVSGPGERGRRRSPTTQVCPGVLKCVQVCPGVLKCIQVCSVFPGVLSVFRCIQVCPGVPRWGVTFSAPGDGDRPCSDSTSPQSPRGAWEHLSDDGFGFYFFPNLQVCQSSGMCGCLSSCRTAPSVVMNCSFYLY